MRFVNYSRDRESRLLFLDEGPIPVSGPHDVLVEVHAFGVNRADILQRKGQYPPPSGASEILGLECSGIVCKTGEDVTTWKVGDEVCGLVDGGAYAEYCVMDSGMIWKKSNILSWAEAAAMPETFLTSYQALYQLMDVSRMRSILIHAAASGVGSAAIQLLRNIPIRKWGTASGSKRSFCLENGYDAIINYQEESFLEKIQEWTNIEGVDAIIDFVGGAYFQNNLKSLALDGTLVMLGTLGGIEVPEVNILPIISRRLRIVGSTLRSRDKIYKQNLVADFVDRYGEEIRNGTIKPSLFKTFNWDEMNQAHAMMEENRNAGKIVVMVK